MNFAFGRVINSCRLLASAVILLSASHLLADSVWLSDLNLDLADQSYSEPHRDRSVDWKPLTIGTNRFRRGFGTHATSALLVELKGSATKLTANVGVDGEISNAAASVEFFVMGDDKTLWQSGVMRAQQPPKAVSVDLTGVQRMTLKVGDAGDGIEYDHADWADAKIEYSRVRPKTITDAPHEEAEILTPTAPATPRINGPAILGVRPGHPVLYHIPATGERPMTFSAKNLPPGLRLDSELGQISGTIAKAGAYELQLGARNSRGTARQKFKLVVGDTLALTPPLGWNSWNCFAGEVTDAKIRMAADAMVSSGLIDHGWSYINIDDTWEGKRDATGMIQSNEKFPDMKALADYVHGKGLKIGIYSSPGPKTCAGFEASWKHEMQDAQQYAAWGFDYLKYDWCSYGGVADGSLPELARFKKPYEVMDAALRAQDRDIVFSLCQYGMGKVWEWGASVGGNCWRTTGDIRDSWGSLCANGFTSAGHEKYAGPGHWNDPDMLIVGNLGWGKVRPSRLTPNEQYTHISLWCLLDSPLLIGCDMAQLDEFTKNLLSNDEVVGVNQDELGRQAARIVQTNNFEIWVKDMADGSKAVGLFNRSAKEMEIKVNWKDLGLTGAHRVRDLWRQTDIGKLKLAAGGMVPRHGVLLYRIW